MNGGVFGSSTEWLALVGVVVVVTLVSHGGTRVLAAVLRTSRFLDHPNARSSHAAPTPRGGGMVIAVVITTSVLASGQPGRATWVVLIFSSSMALLGLMDDLRPLPAVLRLFAQVLASILTAVLIGYDAAAVSAIGASTVALMVLWLVACVNAYNFMDGINGISAFHGVLAGAWFSYLGYTDDVSTLAIFGLPLMAACAGFVPANLASQIFLGDVGSYLLGSLIATLGLVAWSSGVALGAAVSPLLLYLADTGLVIGRRLVGRRPLMVAHREHVYQQLVDGGHSHVRVAGATAAVSTALTLLSGMTEPVLFALVALVVLGAYLCLPRVVTLS